MNLASNRGPCVASALAGGSPRLTFQTPRTPPGARREKGGGGMGALSFTIVEARIHATRRRRLPPRGSVRAHHERPSAYAPQDRWLTLREGACSHGTGPSAHTTRCGRLRPHGSVGSRHARPCAPTARVHRLTPRDAVGFDRTCSSAHAMRGRVLTRHGCMGSHHEMRSASTARVRRLPPREAACSHGTGASAHTTRCGRLRPLRSVGSRHASPSVHAAQDAQGHAAACARPKRRPFEKPPSKQTPDTTSSARS